MSSPASAAPKTAKPPLPPASGPSSTAASGATSATSTASTGSTAPTVPTASDGMDRARASTVVLERKQKPIALGVLLSEKAVVVTALSPILVAGDPNDLEVRFPEAGGTTKVKLHHQDATWDLALLIPTTSKYAEGAKASNADPLSPTAAFSTFVLLKTGKVHPQATAILGRRDYLSPAGETLRDALSIETKNVAIGSPIVDSNGGVAGIVGRACAPSNGASATKSCTATLFGAPLSALRHFLLSAPPIVLPKPWLGVLGVADRMGVRVIQVQDGSPAANAGLRAGDPSSGDTIVAVDNTVTRTAEELAELIRKHGVGDEAKLLVVRGNQVREVKVVLKSLDDPAEAPRSTPVPTVLPSAIVLPLPLPPPHGTTPKGRSTPL